MVLRKGLHTAAGPDGSVSRSSPCLQNLSWLSFVLSTPENAKILRIRGSCKPIETF